MLLKRTATAVACLAFATQIANAEPKTLMMHQWESGSDAAAIAKLGEMFEAAGGMWEQTAVAGHTSNTLAKLRADVVAGSAPAAVQLKGPEIAEWNQTGKTANLDELAAAEGWDDLVAPALLPVMKPTGNWVAVPMNIHRINWIWGNKATMDEAGVTELPKTWDEYNAACDMVAAAGKSCLAHFTADWNDSTLFEIVLYGMSPETFKAAFVEADLDAMRSDEMIAAFDQMRHMMDNHVDRKIFSSDYDTTGNALGNGDAMFEFMGDWFIGNLRSYGFEPGTEIVCAGAPMNSGEPGFILNSDSVVFFEQSDPDYIEGQKMLASLILSPEFQTIFNQAKGSIPARMDVDLSEGFNSCQQIAQADLTASIEAGTLVRSMAHNMTVLQKYRGAMMEIITEFVNSDLSSEEAANLMADEVEAQM
jgi:glucose/mannose transport system substrate-binding protein